MSFILDALRKSETDRQQQGSADFAGIPTSQGAARVPRWLWILGLLLAVNLVLLLGLLLKPAAVPAPLATLVPEARAPNSEALESSSDNNAPAVGEQSFKAKIAAAKRNDPGLQRRVVTAAEKPQVVPGVTAGVVYSPPARNSSALPTLQEVRANGAVTLPDLHLDIHVYSDVPADRFVFINMSKQRENSRLSEGPLIEEITPDGVVLEHQGTTFLLPRE